MAIEYEKLPIGGGTSQKNNAKPVNMVNIIPNGSSATPKATNYDNSKKDTGTKKATNVKGNPSITSGLQDLYAGAIDMAKGIIDAKNNQVTGYLDTTEAQTAMANIQNSLDALHNIDKSNMNAIYDKIRNRDPFSYDASKDQLFQNAMANGMKSGQLAMADTMGQAAALTGGYGSSYATQAGAGAYANVINNVMNQLPEYYKLNLEAYNNETDNLYRQLDMERNLVNDEKNDILTDIGIQRDNLSMGSEDFWNKVGQSNEIWNHNYKKERDAVADKQWQDTFDRGVYEFDTNLEQRKQEHADDVALSNAKLAQSASQFAEEMALKRENSAKEDAQQAWQNDYYNRKLMYDNGYELDSNGNWVKAPTTTKSDLKTNDANLPKVKAGAVDAFLSGGRSGLEDYVGQYGGHYTDDVLMDIMDYALGHSSTSDMQSTYDFEKGTALGNVDTLRISGTDKTLTKKDIDNLNLPDEIKKILKGLKEGQSYDPQTNQIADVKKGVITDAKTGKVIQKINVAKKYR